MPEVRNVIEKYEEISPLYGFLQYRRRKVILRYMPEGMSRLIQGKTCKVAVHLTAKSHRDSDFLSQPEAMSNFSPSPRNSLQTTPCCL